MVLLEKEVGKTTFIFKADKKSVDNLYFVGDTIKCMDDDFVLNEISMIMNSPKINKRKKQHFIIEMKATSKNTQSRVVKNLNSELTSLIKKDGLVDINGRGKLFTMLKNKGY
jgi:hypothetical protein